MAEKVRAKHSDRKSPVSLIGYCPNASPLHRRRPMKMQGFEPRFSQNLAPVSREKPQNPYFAYISHLFSKP
ncbi:hypothetical protein FXO09_10055 [Microcystis aeruginosa KLA2]|nr:MAG: hypothetical protein EWV62_12795 [Microcystis aeruginosa Ma_OC_LR_19540900_S633]TYT71360.1 hypothetical protein FXO09_10055 [Microcystis aeruginosa KLA2]